PGQCRRESGPPGRLAGSRAGHRTGKRGAKARPAHHRPRREADDFIGRLPLKRAMLGMMLWCGLAAPVSPLRAQTARLALNGGGALVRLQRAIGLRTDELSGVMASGDGRLSLGRFELEAGYLEGRLQPRGSTTA